MNVALALAAVLVLDKAWKHWAVVRFLKQPAPPPVAPRRISVVQAILSGDPLLEGCLRHNLHLRGEVEFIWLLDDDDPVAQTLCARLVAAHPSHSIRLVALPPPLPHQNPKMVKLIAGSACATGEVVCVLDDDTMLPPDAFEACLPYLEQPNVGLAFGLPYYVSFGTFWSQLVSVFVNNNSLLTYIPYTQLIEPCTINGMFYLLPRPVLDAIGGFEGLETILADDFAIAQRVRAHGYMLCQTPLRHAIATTVDGPRRYHQLMRRWFVFPRESLLRHLSLRERLVMYITQLLPALAPLVLLLACVLRPSRRALLGVLAYVAHSSAVFAHCNAAYLHRATPWRYSWLVPLLQIVLPLQLLEALVAPQRIVWRGHEMHVEPGGGLRTERRRTRRP